MRWVGGGDGARWRERAASQWIVRSAILPSVGCDQRYSRAGIDLA